MALESRLIPLSAAQAWGDALIGLPHFFAHTHGYNAAMARASGLETYLYAASGEGFRAACPISIRYKEGKADAVSPYGFSGFAVSGSYPGFAEAFSDFMATQNVVAGYIVMNPLLPCEGLAKEGELSWGKECFLLDLTQPEDELWGQMARDHRSRLRAWLQEAPEISSDKAALKDAFLSLYPASMERSNAAASYDFGEAALGALIESELALLVGANGAEAVSLFLAQGNYAEYYLSASTEGGRRHARGLIWQALPLLKARGVTTLNLGCGIRQDDQLEEFKRRFGGAAKRFGIFKSIYRPDEYAMLCRSRACDPLDRSGFFPPYHRPEPERIYAAQTQ